MQPPAGWYPDPCGSSTHLRYWDGAAWSEQLQPLVGPVQLYAAAYGFAMLVRRWLATLIDYVLVFGILLAADGLLGNDLYQRTLWIWLPLAVLYIPVCEAVWGRTVGKLVVRTVVVREDGGVPGVHRAATRTVLRLVELNPILVGGIPALISYLCTRHHQRLGDLAAGTFVLTVVDRDAVRAAGR